MKNWRDLLFRQLTKEHCIYQISDELLNAFVLITQQYELEGYVSSAASLNTLNSHAVVLQIWCMLNEKELKLVIDTDKIMPYSIDNFILNLLRSHKKIDQYLRARTMTRNSTYVLSYYLACATLQWGDQVILEYQEGPALCEENSARDYFTISASENLVHLENHDFYVFQKNIIHLMANDYTNSDYLDRHIEDALNYTRTFLYTHS